MMNSTILIFPDQNSAALAVSSISVTMGLTSSTFVFAIPRPLVDGRWYIPQPTDPAWMQGVTGYVQAARTGEAAVGEQGPPSIPTSITNAQARAVMLGIPSPSGTAGRTLFDDVDTAIKARGGAALQFWEYGNDFDRNGALVGSMAAQFGFSPAQLDQIFITGSALTI